MSPIANATEVISLLFRPIGFKASDGKKATIEEIEKWREKENPNIILQQSYLTIGSAIATVIGAVLGAIGLKKDSKPGKWLGGILGLVGIAASGFGIYVAKLMRDVTEKAKKSNDAAQKISEMPILISLQEISGENDASRQNEMRRELISSHIRDLGKLKELLERVKSTGKDKKLVEEAECCLKILYEEVQRVPNMIACLKNKSLSSSVRTGVIDELLQADQSKAIEALASVCADKNDDPKVRITFTNSLQLFVDRFSKKISTLDKQKIRKIFAECINDKTDDSKVRNTAIIACSLRYEGLELPLDELLELLIQRLKDKDDHIEVHEAAAKTVGIHGDEGTLKILNNIIEGVRQRLADKTPSKGLDRTAVRLFGALTSAIENIERRISKKSSE